MLQHWRLRNAHARNTRNKDKHTSFRTRAQVLDCSNNGDYEEAARLSERLAALDAQVDEKTERWMKLEERADIP